MTNDGTVIGLAAVLPRRQFDARLQTEIVRGQKALVAGEELDVAQTGNAGATDLVRRDLGGRKRLALHAVRRVIALHVRQQQRETPIRIGAVADVRLR
ncbi:MAG: hypothetical protein M3R20_03930 [Pseudomonadota bacterium]|nr:hypothetical protein [Pseudomonadota bacterium]